MVKYLPRSTEKVEAERRRETETAHINKWAHGDRLDPFGGRAVVCGRRSKAGSRPPDGGRGSEMRARQRSSRATKTWRAAKRRWWPSPATGRGDRAARRRPRSGDHFGGEFDPGSGSTLAACLMHASRTGVPSGALRGGRVRNTWAICPAVGASRRKRRVIPHVRAI